MSVEVHNPCFKFGFNTLGAYASINHLHFQGYFLNAPFPVERVETEYLQTFGSKGDRDLRVSKLLDYPVRAMVFELGADLKELAMEVSHACNVPEEVLDTQVNPACFEIGGHMVMKRAQDYKDLTEDKVCEILSYASLTEAEFTALEKDLFASTN